jgi:hypothetical protein
VGLSKAGASGGARSAIQICGTLPRLGFFLRAERGGPPRRRGVARAGRKSRLPQLRVVQEQTKRRLAGLLPRGHSLPRSPTAPVQCVNWPIRRLLLKASLSERSEEALRQASPPPLLRATRPASNRAALRARGRREGGSLRVRQDLREQGIPSDGCKAELVARLVEARRDSEAAILAAEARAAGKSAAPERID